MELIILFAPLVGAIIGGFGWKIMGEAAAQWLTTGLLFLAAILSWVIMLTFDASAHENGYYWVEIMTWIQSGTLDTSWGIRMDRLTAIMLVVINTVSALVHLYSFGYMAHDEQFPDTPYKARFFAYLSFFTFAMLMLVTSGNLVQMFFGWEGVGVASYLLIGFYYKKPSANAAAIKAFVVNRVGDFGFALGIFAIFYVTGSINFDVIFAEAHTISETTLHFLWRDWNAAEVIALLLFIGAMGKSAQLFLHTWLPDAMEGPTPVSALIHAATMVTAGVFLVCRMSPIMEFAPSATGFIVFLGATTAFFAATVGLVQNDIKRVIAYSTCSQLGYMFVAAGLGVYSVAMFHLLTHAFFKAMLFLGAGSVIHGMHHEQDMRNYGGLKDKLPYTFWAMMIGTLAITGVGIPLLYLGFPVGFAGFVSKDAIIESAYAGTMGGYAFWMLVVAALFTSFYSWRLMFLTFYGKPRGDKHTHEHAHESPKVMLAPLAILAVGAIFAGMVFYKPFFGNAKYVGQYFGVAYAEQGHGDDHAMDGHTDDTHADDDHAATVEEHHDEEAENHGDASHNDEANGYDAAEDDHGETHYAFDGEPGEGAIYVAHDNTTLDDAHLVPVWVKLAPFFAMLLGFVTAYIFYIRKPELPRKLAEQQAPLYNFLLNKWYFDELYDAIFVKPAMKLGKFLWKRGDGNVIDGTINGVAMGLIPMLTRLAGRAQSGYVFTYAFAMVIGIVVILTYFTITGGYE
ncbi:NADH-quinone oxidoreductase subunit L [Octadecabacter sp. 1_MG-2023]|uniref:NADH-quinone oxidoreductase subunit L n=1 Tax=unclassified Octadecabacter TaxID=196158 RepID=UPI001C08F2FD|nr:MULTISPECIES: NADH-quinone oxidoreductase subunit L [unclassified Octadecabacter]MBU2993801.1 NADH-quinone oxidoreductase subunit L [Octadecabacter sp. B2R22]MDO6735354.1 NADH-quinone oxidoreductase subunit L [Octadecabacter sp. 1_MG-2023]